MASPIPTLRTERLLLRPFAVEDAGAVEALLAGPEVAATTLNIAHPYPAGAAAGWIAAHGAAARGEGFAWAVVRAADGRLMGAITLRVDQQHRRGELAYWLGAPFWGRGCATEAARRVVAFGFGELRLHRVEAGVFPRNPASARVLAKTGLRHEGTPRGYVRKGGALEDVAMWAALRDEWAG